MDYIASYRESLLGRLNILNRNLMSNCESPNTLMGWFKSGCPSYCSSSNVCRARSKTFASESFAVCAGPKKHPFLMISFWLPLHITKPAVLIPYLASLVPLEPPSNYRCTYGPGKNFSFFLGLAGVFSY